MRFCVECGAEGETLEGLCADDFARRHTLLRAPERIDLVRCSHCGSIKTNGSWVEVDLQDHVLDLLAARVERDPHVARVRYTHELRPEDERNVAVTAKAVCRVGPWDLVTSLHTRVRFHGGACPTCSKARGGYYVGTIQVRADGRGVTADESRRARDVAERLAASGGREQFVSRVEEVRGGLDVLVSTNALAKQVARELARELGGTVTSSATLHTQREGKDMYRATFAVRLPAFRDGDVILWRRRRYRVVGKGDPLRLEDVATGERLRVRIRELKGARVVPD